jgi:hypothetical protein
MFKYGQLKDIRINMGNKKYVSNFLWRNLRRSNRLKNLGTEGRIIFQLNFEIGLEGMD